MFLPENPPLRFTFFHPNPNGKRIRNSLPNCGMSFRSNWKRNYCWTGNILNRMMNSDGCSSVSLTGWGLDCCSDGCNWENLTGWGLDCCSDGYSSVNLTGWGLSKYCSDGCSLEN
jgi:hypothetical protein